MNDPAVTIVVILDSAVGLHQGGQIAAPVFKRIAQQVLAYLNVPHDLELQPAKLRMQRAALRDSDLEESSPDRVAGAAMADDAPVEARLSHSESPLPHLQPASLTLTSASRRNDDL